MYKNPFRAGADRGTGGREVAFPIGAKLVTIISILVVLSLGSITGLVTFFVSGDVRITAEENNHTVNARSASAAGNAVATVRSNAFLLLDLMNAAEGAGAVARQAPAFFFERNPDVAAIAVADPRGTTKETRLVNARYFLANEVDSSLVDSFLAAKATSIARAAVGEALALNAAPEFGVPIIALFYPWKEYGYDQAAVILFSSERISEALGSGTVNGSFLVNGDGDLLVAADFDRVKAGASERNHPLVKAMLENNDENRQISFKAKSDTTSKKERFFGAYTRLSDAELAVLTTVPASIVFEGVRKTTLQNALLTASVLFLAVLFIWFFSKSISLPIRRLTDAAADIERGVFAVELASHSKDEIGVLAGSFVSMASGLAERERLKDAFGKFSNKELAEKAMRGELTLGGESKEATVFFSDIRSFTAISERLEPFEVVEFLNEYMTRMVACVNATGGVVDKFIGDAVMAVWGAPVSAGSPADDALNCVRAALMMRAALREFNEGRGGDRKPVIRIGCGINSGPLIAGQIGSHERMEYTVIGDSVNFASRTEALNKPLGTDILITENTWRLVADLVTVEEMPAVTVKGKEKPVRLFAVVNMPGETAIPGAGANGFRTLAEVRAALGIPTPDYAKVDLDAEEKKYSVQA